MEQSDFSNPANDRELTASAVTDEMLDRYLAGRARGSERVAIERFIAATPGMTEWMTKLREIQAREDGAATVDLARGWERFSERISFAPHYNTHRIGETSISVAAEREPRRIAARGFTQRAWYTFVGAAMAIVLIVAGAVLQHDNIFRRHTSESLYTTYTTTAGQRATITLSDGSTVALNVASRLDVPVNYAHGERALRLQGEALFTVLHHDANPLTVTTGGTTTRVLGTSFIMRYYESDTTVTVAVREGKVAIRSITLTTGKQVTMSRNGQAHVDKTDPAQFSFVSGVLTLPGMSLQEAIPELDRWYNADIQLGDSVLRSQRVHGKLAAGSVAELESMLEWTYNVRVVRDGRVLTLFPR